MRFLVLLFLSATADDTIIDGKLLWKRAQATVNEQSYARHLDGLMHEALNKALYVADRGEYQMTYCVLGEGFGKHTAFEVRTDLMRILGRINGLSAFYVPNRACLELNWSQQ